MPQQPDLARFAINENLDSPAFKQSVYNKRLELIQIPLAWEGAEPQGHLIAHTVWVYPQDTSYKVCLGKFGKEHYEPASSAYSRLATGELPENARKNINDMRPSVFRDEQLVDAFRARFDDIFKLLEDCNRQGLTDVVRAFAILFFRNALLLDHPVVHGRYVYCPPQPLIDFICRSVPEYEGIPMEVYIHALDAIGLNEDVKYYTQQKLQKKRGIGRENNMKTYCYAAACILGYEHWAGFIYMLMRQYGVAPITNRMFSTYFPEANTTFSERAPRPKAPKSEVITIERFVSHLE